MKALEGRNGLKLAKLGDPNFLRTLENCIRIGAGQFMMAGLGQLAGSIAWFTLRKQHSTRIRVMQYDKVSGPSCTCRHSLTPLSPAACVLARPQVAHASSKMWESPWTLP